MNGKRKKRKCVAEKRGKEQQPQEVENKDCESVESEGSEPGTRPGTPDSQEEKKRKREPKQNPKGETKTRGAKLANFALQMKEARWDKKNADTIYSSNSTKKQSSNSQYSDTENETNESSSNSRDKNISDVSDSEEPELKKLKFRSYDPLPSDNKMFEKDMAMSWTKGKLKLSQNPLEWSVDDVYAYLSNTEDCKLIADRIKQEEVDGQAFVMLDATVIREFLHMKKEFALQLSKHIDMIRWYTNRFENCDLN